MRIRCPYLLRRVNLINIRCCALSIFLTSLMTVMVVLVVLTHDNPTLTLTAHRKDVIPSKLNKNAPIRMIDDSIQMPNPVTWITTKREIRVAPKLLLITIQARGNGLALRTAIRSTWISSPALKKLKDKYNADIEYKFILGIQNISYNLLANLTREAEVHKDMVMLSDVTDQHKSLTNRTLKSFQYISRHLSNYLYVLKCDDDTFINLMEITHVLATQESKERLYWGYFGGDCKIYNDGKYAETEWKICNLYLPYAFGGGYILSMDLIKLVASNAPYLKMYKNEDVSVGAWLAPYNIKYLFDARFHTGTNRGCKRPYILYHRVDANLTYNYYDKVQRYGYFCTKKNQWHLLHGYLYNWKVQPSKCCYRRRRNSYP